MRTLVVVGRASCPLLCGVAIKEMSQLRRQDTLPTLRDSRTFAVLRRDSFVRRLMNELRCARRQRRGSPGNGATRHRSVGSLKVSSSDSNNPWPQLAMHSEHSLALNRRCHAERLTRDESIGAFCHDRFGQCSRIGGPYLKRSHALADSRAANALTSLSAAEFTEGTNSGEGYASRWSFRLVLGLSLRN